MREAICVDASFVEVLDLREGDVIFREGDAGNCMYAVEHGRVGIFVNYGTESEKLLTELKKGETFGDMGMVRGYPRSATAVALGEGTSVSVITWETLCRLFREQPVRIVSFMQQMSDRIEALTAEYVEACGAVKLVMEQRDALCAENRELSGRLDALHAMTPGQTPLWQRIGSARGGAQDESIRRFIGAYRRLSGRPGNEVTVEERQKVEKVRRGIWNSLNFEQKEKAEACKTMDELTAFAGREGVELPDELLNSVAGGDVGMRLGELCPHEEKGTRGADNARRIRVC